MSFEGKSKKSEQQFESPENKFEKELSLSEIKELLKERVGIFDSLDKFSKDEFYKKEDFEDLRVTAGKLDDRFDEESYAKAGFWDKYDNFCRLGFYKKKYGLLKSKERGLLDKTAIDSSVAGKEIDVDYISGERPATEEIIVNSGVNREDVKKRIITKRYEIIDGEIVKIIKSHRTESGEVEAAGKMREKEISQLEIMNGVELVGLKDAMERSAKSKESFLRLGESMSSEEREKVTAKLNEEENQAREKIKEKEEKLAEETKIFREPLGGRLQETLEIQNSLTEAFDFVKTGESNLNKQIKDCDSFIREAQKLDLLGEVGSDVVKIFEDKKALLDAQAKEFAERRELISSKLEVLKNNEKEIETTLSRVNNIGKTKQEIAEEEKNKKKVETKTKTTEEKKDEKEEKSKKTKGGKRAEQKTVLPNKRGNKKDYIGELFEHYGGVSKEEEKAGDEEKGEIENPKVKEFSEKEIKEIVIKELKTLGVMSIKDRTMRDVITAVEAMIAKSKEPVEENKIKKEVKEWYKKSTKNISNKNKQFKPWQ